MVKRAKPSAVKANTVGQLTFENLQRLDKRNDETKTIEVKGYKIKINKVFRDTKIQELLSELVTFREQIRKLDVPVEEMDFTGVTFGLILRHFSDLPVPDSVAGLMGYVQLLIDNGFLTQIISQFDKENMQKVTISMENAHKNALIMLEHEAKKSSGE